MPVILTRRATHLREFMDDPHCDQKLLYNTYRQFASVNRLVSRWQTVYRRFIKPKLSPERTTTLLDIGFGGGDVPLLVDRLAKADDLKLSITGIETDPRALEYASRMAWPESITLKHASTTELVRQRRRYDLVISNHLLHHLDENELRQLTSEAQQLANRRIVFNDIHRGDLAWMAFTLTRPFYRNSFITADGLRSIRRSYTTGELKALLPEDWFVQPVFPYRLIAGYDVPNAES